MKIITTRSKFPSSVAAFAVATLFTQPPLEAAEKAIASFGNDDSLASWTSVNDGVMGGVSKGGFKRSEQGTLLFTGELSLANNGGFASIRMKQGDLGLAGTSGVVVKARGDGRTYWVDLRTMDQMAASSYRAYLPTVAGEWKETLIPFKDFKLQSFGRELPFKPIRPAAIGSVGFTIADKKEGPFSLEIESVKATGDAADAEAKDANTLLDVAKAAGGFKTLNASELIELAIERGVPVFNEGDVAGCAAIYEITIEALRSMDSVPEKFRDDLAEPIKAARAETSARKRAWILREAIDKTWTSLNGKK